MRDAAVAADFHRTVEATKLLLGDEHPDTLTSIYNLAAALLDLGDAQRARALVAEALPVALRKYGRAPEVSRHLSAWAEHLGVPVP
ncbi:tetratricopeptide repeat protein [Skermanella sp. TT6]|uniref:Tetratricopeptide repeat protein n=1 Tax=Skermanella cutis TaxID=2775420 RepID=A0ABX7B230_9PROT|nr:tetratricopeptide repeat protein [Skermanella sp. TT6]QQP88370.1 tetratricopeptide repeat protein [Skermanella sp. TT6]